MLFKSFLALGLLIPSFAVAQSAWRADLDKGRQAFARQQYGEALEKFRGAEQAARAEGNDTALSESLRLLAAVLRESGDAAQAEQILKSAADEFAKSRGETSLELAVMSEDSPRFTGLKATPRPSLSSTRRSLFATRILKRPALTSPAISPPPRLSASRPVRTSSPLSSSSGQSRSGTRPTPVIPAAFRPSNRCPPSIAMPPIMPMPSPCSCAP